MPFVATTIFVPRNPAGNKTVLHFMVGFVLTVLLASPSFIVVDLDWSVKVEAFWFSFSMYESFAFQKVVNEGSKSCKKKTNQKLHLSGSCSACCSLINLNLFCFVYFNFLTPGTSRSAEQCISSNVQYGAELAACGRSKPRDYAGEILLSVSELCFSSWSD